VRGALGATLLALCAAVAAAAAAAQPGDESARSAAAAARIERQWPLAGPSPLTGFIRRIGHRLGERAGATPFPWRFFVVRDRSANAFAIGGGRIYVNEGVVTLCETEAELAAILAHEMGHQVAGHFAEAPAADAASGARIDLGAVTQRIDPEKEIEADRIALGILRKAGYDPHAALTLALRQQDAAGSAAPPHADGEPRIAALRAALADVAPAGRVDSAAYREVRREALERLG